jgi:hypothetical protein
MDWSGPVRFHVYGVPVLEKTARLPWEVEHHCLYSLVTLVKSSSGAFGIHTKGDMKIR